MENWPRLSRRLTISESLPSSSPFSCSDSIEPFRTSDALYGPYLAEHARELVEIIEKIEHQVLVAKAYTNVLRRATFASERTVLDVLRYTFQTPELIQLIGHLVEILGDVHLFARPAGGKDGD